MILTIIILAIIYIASCYLYYRVTQKAYSKNGAYYGLKPDIHDIAFTFAPIINTCMVLVTYLDKIDTNNFFNIKDE